MNNNKLKYILIWLLPFILLCVCGYNFVNAAWIYVTVTDSIQRLDGFAYLIMGIFYSVIFIVSSVIALALTVYIYRKNLENRNTKGGAENEESRENL